MARFFNVVALSNSPDRDGNLNPFKAYGPAPLENCAKFVLEAVQGPTLPYAFYAIIATDALGR